MNKIKLFFMKLSYYIVLHTGIYVVNERKYENHIENLSVRKKNILELENEINKNK